MTENTLRVGFVGLGIMGAPMANNILSAGFPLTVWNRTPARAEPLAAAGAKVAASPAEVAAASDVTISCVTDSPDVEAVALGPGGIAEGAKAGSIYIDCSTIAPEVARRVAAVLGEKGVAMLDAPVSGGDVGAKAGTLAIMVGGEADAFERALPVLQAMGKTIVHVGPSGAGQVVKLCNQVAGALNLLAMSEAISLARRSGVSPEKMLEVVSAGAAGSWMLSNLGPPRCPRRLRPRLHGPPPAEGPAPRPRTGAGDERRPPRHRPRYAALPHARSPRPRRRRHPGPRGRRCPTLRRLAAGPKVSA